MEVRQWTYDEYPEFTEPVAGAVRVPTTGDEPGARYTPDVPYATVDGTTLHLQIMRPVSRNRGAAPAPCIVYVQGSAWRKQDCHADIPQIGRLAARGYVVAVAEYRHTGIALFPAQIRDAQNAVRFMHAHAAEYGADPGRIIMMGNSSGGHTAVFCGILNDGEDSLYPGVSARVSGIIDLYGAVSLMRDDGFPTTVNHHLPDSPEGALMAADLRAHPELRAQASAERCITPDLDLPPLLIAHGTKDRTVSPQLSVDLYERARACGKEAYLYLLEGADHGGPEFFSPAMCEIYDAFCRHCLGEKVAPFD